jgi:hypothetical protein
MVFNTIHDINARSSEFAADEENKLLKRYDQGRCNLFIHIDPSHGAIIDSKKTSKMELYLPCRTHLPLSKKKVPHANCMFSTPRGRPAKMEKRNFSSVFN